jgi:hypothetical protein
MVVGMQVRHNSGLGGLVEGVESCVQGLWVAGGGGICWGVLVRLHSKWVSGCYGGGHAGVPQSRFDEWGCWFTVDGVGRFVIWVGLRFGVAVRHQLWWCWVCRCGAVEV